MARSMAGARCAFGPWAGLLAAVRQSLDQWTWEVPVPSLADTAFHPQVPAVR